MTAVMTDTLEDLLLESNFDIACAHSQHGAPDRTHHDDGPAAYWCEVKHDCPARPGVKGTVYPACRAYGLYLIHDAYAWWRCSRCDELTLVCQAVVTVGLINKES